MTNALREKVSTMEGQLEIEIWSDDFQHAIDGHPEVTIEKVKGTLENPSRVLRSKGSSNTCLFYSVGTKISETENLYFCVVVAVIGSCKGKLVTAYDADFIKNGTELYSKK